MSTAAEIARKALEEEERPKREQQRKEKLTAVAKAQRAARRTEAAAKRRLAQSPIPEWFPGVEWKFVERDSYGVLLYGKMPITGFFDVWQSGEEGDYDMIRLLWHDNGNVYFARYKGFSHERRRDEWDWLVEVNSPADVARALSNYHSRTAVPAGAE